MPRLIAAASDLALVVDQQGVIEHVAIGEAIQSHATWSSLVGKRWKETIANDSQSKVDQLLTEARSGEVARAREINQQAEGGAAPFRFSAVLLDDSQQRVVALGRDLRAVAMMQQQMLAAQQAMDREFSRLRQAETRYRLLFQVAAEGVLVADATSFKVLEANPAAAALFEEAPGALQGWVLKDVFEAKSWTTVQAMLAALAAGGRPADAQVALAHRDAEVLVSASLFRQSGVTLLLLRLRPLSSAVSAAGTRDARMLTALNALPDGFVVVDEERRILCANTAFCEMVQQATEAHVIGQPLERWLGRPGVDLEIIVNNLREHGTVRNFATIMRGDYGAPQEAVVSAVSAVDGKVPCLGFSIRTVPMRLAMVPFSGLPMLRSVDQLRELVGRVSLKEIVRECADLIERLFIEAALKVSGDNRASAAQLLGLSRQGLYSKLRRYGLGDLEPMD